MNSLLFISEFMKFSIFWHLGCVSVTYGHNNTHKKTTTKSRCPAEISSASYLWSWVCRLAGVALVPDEIDSDDPWVCHSWDFLTLLPAVLCVFSYDSKCAWVQALLHKMLVKPWVASWLWIFHWPKKIIGQPEFGGQNIHRLRREGPGKNTYFQAWI